jgi:histidine phosphotransferase ChpT
MMPQPAVHRTETADGSLATLLCVRLCHDLGGVIGALSGALELFEGPEDDALSVARDAARILDRRLCFFRAAIGGGIGDSGVAELEPLVEGITLGRKARISLEELPPGLILPAGVAQALLIALWLGVDALPRGGTVRASGGDGVPLSVWPDGPSAAWSPGLTSWLAGGELPVGPKLVGVPLLGAAARAAGLRIDLAMGAGSAAPVLLLAR